MPIYIRRIIFAFFVCVFFVSAAGILFYGSGYRWNGAKNKIEKTGQLSIDSKPKGAEVFINGDSSRKTWKKIFRSSPVQTTPTNIQNLLPGEYIVEIKKDGYYPWKKDVRIVSGQTALFHGIRLLKNETPVQMIAGDILQFSMFPNDTLVALTKKDLFLTDTQKKTVQSLFHSDKEDLSLFTARADGGQFFLRSGNKQWVVDVKGESVKMPDTNDDSFSTIRWSNNDEIFGKTKNGITQVSLAPLALKRVVSGYMDDFFVRDERIFTIEGEKQKSVNVRELTHSKQSPVEVLALPLSGGLFLDEQPSHDIAIQKKAGGIVILSPTGNKNAFTILELENISELSGKKNGVFLGWNDVELWKYTLSGREYGKILITRQSVPLQKAFYSDIVPAIFFLSNNSVTMIDMADTASIHQIQMFGWEGISDMALSENEKDFFISGVLHGVSGLYRLSIID